MTEELEKTSFFLPEIDGLCYCLLFMTIERFEKSFDEAN